MKIYDRDLTGSAAAEPGRAQETQRSDRGTATTPSGSGGGSGDRVELSSGLASVTRALSSHFSDRAGKVQQLSAQFHSGNYQADSLATSQGIVREALSSRAG